MDKIFLLLAGKGRRQVELDPCAPSPVDYAWPIYLGNPPPRSTIFDGRWDTQIFSLLAHDRKFSDKKQNSYISTRKAGRNVIEGNSDSSTFPSQRMCLNCLGTVHWCTSADRSASSDNGCKLLILHTNIWWAQESETEQSRNHTRRSWPIIYRN